MDKRTIRNYCEIDDLEAIMNLYKLNQHLFSRDVKLFKHFLEFPGVQNDSIFVSLANGTVDGIMIISIIGDRRGILVGKIIELLAISTFSTDDLIKKAEEYCVNRGADIIYLKPTVDISMLHALNKWIKYETPGVVMAKPLVILPIFKAVLNINLIHKYYINRNLLFVFDKEAIKLQVTQDSLDITHATKETENSDVRVMMESKTFLGIVFGSINPHLAYLNHKIRIHGVREIFTILRLLSSLKIDTFDRISLADSV